MSSRVFIVLIDCIFMFVSRVIGRNKAFHGLFFIFSREQFER